MVVDRQKLFQVFQQEGGICQQCSHFKTCRKPCRPVMLYLNHEMSLNTWEKTITKSNGEEVTVMVSHRELTEADLFKEGGDEDHVDKLTPFNTEAESPFLSGGPDTSMKMTGIFIDRFFNRMTFKDLAVKYDCKNRGHAWHIYKDAVNRLRVLLSLLEKEQGAKLKLEHVKKKFKDKIGDIPKAHKYFLLNRLLDIDPETIARLEGEETFPAEVRKMIIRVNDGLRCGEIRLFDATPQEIAESKNRIEAHRAVVRNHDRKRRAKAV